MADSDPDIGDCWLRARAGDAASSARLVEHLYPLVIRIVRSHLPRMATGEDLAQEVFMKIFARMDQYRGDSPLEHWVSRIAVTTCLDHLRRQKRRPEVRWADLTEGEEMVIQNLAAERAATDPHEAVQAREVVDRLLSGLSPEDQLVIRLLDLEEKSVAQVRELTGWGISMIKVRAFRARRKMRKRLERLKGDA